MSLFENSKLFFLLKNTNKCSYFIDKIDFLWYTKNPKLVQRRQKWKNSGYIFVWNLFCRVCPYWRSEATPLVYLYIYKGTRLRAKRLFLGVFVGYKSGCKQVNQVSKIRRRQNLDGADAHSYSQGGVL